MSKDSGIIYIMDMESGLGEALAHRTLQMGQQIIFRKWNMEIDAVDEINAYGDVLKGLIISGSVRNINSKRHDPPTVPAELFNVNVPVLAICYGMQYMAHVMGRRIVRCWGEKELGKRTKHAAKKDTGEQGPTEVGLTEEGKNSPLFKGLAGNFDVWMKHNWMVEDLPEGWTLTGSTERCPIACMERDNMYATQFHPELSNSLAGKRILHNFFTHICEVNTPYF